jgi:predicted alpha/beta superfamily hydrolase
MNRRHFTLAAATVAATASPAIGQTAAEAPPLPSVTVGRIERLAPFPSRHVDARIVDVWLPPGYDARQAHAVLYMHDGQMLFDATTTWNRQAWDAHLAVARLMAGGRIVPTIVVGVFNNGKRRHSEYFPERALAHLPPALRSELVARGLDGQPRADAYLRFLAEELKPAIDARYATRREAAWTAVTGSSMGGLISLYAGCERPDVFGLVGALSTHWIGSFEPNATVPLALLTWLRERLPRPAGRRLYLDTGNAELDAHYPTWHAAAAQVIRDAGYGEGREAMIRLFDGAGHHERAWAARLEEPLAFLLAPRR